MLSIVNRAPQNDLVRPRILKNPIWQVRKNSALKMLLAINRKILWRFLRKLSFIPMQAQENHLSRSPIRKNSFWQVKIIPPLAMMLSMSRFTMTLSTAVLLTFYFRRDNYWNGTIGTTKGNNVSRKPYHTVNTYDTFV